MKVDSGEPVVREPHPNLLKYYFLTSLATVPFFPVAMAYGWFRYHTLRYTFDSEGVQVRWGILFRREVALTYARIQDIHLVSNFVERWLGLARIQVQTASASGGAELVVEGLQDFEAIRDFLYSRMRGAKSPREAAMPTDAAEDSGLAEAVRELHRAADELAELRRRLTGGAA